MLTKRPEESSLRSSLSQSTTKWPEKEENGFIAKLFEKSFINFFYENTEN